MNGICENFEVHIVEARHLTSDESDEEINIAKTSNQHLKETKVDVG